MAKRKLQDEFEQKPDLQERRRRAAGRSYRVRRGLVPPPQPRPVEEPQVTTGLAQPPPEKVPPLGEGAPVPGIQGYEQQPQPGPQAGPEPGGQSVADRLEKIAEGQEKLLRVAEEISQRHFPAILTALKELSEKIPQPATFG